MSNIENLTELYKDVSATLRHYSNLRFAQLTIFIAIIGGLFAVLSSQNSGSAIIPIHAFQAIGILITFAFWIMEERIKRYWDYHRKCAEEIEDRLDLDFHQYKGRPKYRLISGRTAARMLFIGIILFWSTATIWYGSFEPAIPSGATIPTSIHLFT